MTRLYRYAIAVFALFALGSWGFFAHRISPQLATYYLPKNMQPFFFANLDKLVYDSVRPDVRRNTDPKEAPRHFIDFEVFGDSAAWKMPEKWEDAARKYPADTLYKYGTLPWRVQEMQLKLTEAFRQQQKDSILYYAAEVCHYVGDAHVPLHTSYNYDGQLTNQRGIHALWESMLPELDIAEYRLNHKHKARYITDPQHHIWEILRNTHVLVQGVFAEERKASESIPDSVKYRTQIRNGKSYQYYTPVFARSYSKRLADEVQHQLVATAEAVSDYWYTCWVNAGKPDLSAIQAPSESLRADLKNEKKAWRKNELLAKGLLRARKGER